jgi:hypothetical protein
MLTEIPLGFEVETGKPVAIPVRNLVVTGQTQESGKTTTLEALVARSGLRAIAFVTKRGERSFAVGRRIQPYFRDRADWQFVDQLLEAQLREKNKFLRPWIMKICRQTRTLAEVHQAVRKALAKATGFNEGIYTQLDAYLDLIVPEIARAKLADRIHLEPGLNVMDVSGYGTPMQMLFVQSAIDWINEHEHDVVTIIPEAWEFIPETKGSPVKASAIALVRKGSGIRNYIWVDSQDTAGVDKTILRGCPVWLIGVQREANEIKRNLANIPASVKRPSAAAVATLSRGQFFVCFGATTIRTYVQPAWLDAKNARAIARGEPHVNISTLETRARVAQPSERRSTRSEAGGSTPPPRSALERFVKGGQAAQRAVDEVLAEHKEETVTPAEAKQLREENEDLRRRNVELEERVRKLEAEGATGRPPAAPSTTGPWRRTANDYAELFQEIKARLLEELPSNPAVLRILAARPELRVEVERQVVTVDGTSSDGWIGRLIADGWFDDIKTGYSTFQELLRRGAKLAKPSAYTWCDNMVRRGFLTKEGKEGYRVVAGMKVNVVER